MIVEIFKITLYTCGCGYKTTNNGNAIKHKKVACGHEMKNEKKEMVLKEDYDNKGNIVIDGDHNTANVDNSTHTTTNIDNSTHTTNITLVLPEKTTKEDFLDFLGTLGNLGYRSAREIIDMPGKMLMFTRDAKKLPGALIERNNKIIEKLPDGSERVMGKKKAVQTYTHEAVDALCKKPPSKCVDEYLEEYRGLKKNKMSVQDAAMLRATDPVAYHHEVPAAVKAIQQRIETNTEKCLNLITTENKTNGFL